MFDTLLILVVFSGITIGVWLSYRFFMHGSTDAEKVAKLLPAGFKPDWEFRFGDTYVGFEGANNRLVLVDWPHAKVATPQEVRSVEKMDESICGLRHRWVIIHVDDPKTPHYRVWFRFSSTARDEWYAKLLALKKASPVRG